MNPRDLLLVMFFESGLNPAAKNKNGGAAGLIQFMPATLKGMGVNPRGFDEKSALDQLNYVKRYIDGKKGIMNGKPFTSATQYYHANFFPATLVRWNGSDPVRNRNVVVVSSRSSSQQERAAYKENKVLDKDGNGVITVGDLTATLMQAQNSHKFQQALQQLNNVAGQGTVSENMGRKKTINMKVDNEPSMIPFISKLDKLLDSIMIAASDKNRIVISVNSDSDFSSKLEYASILKQALKEECDINCNIYTDNKNIEVEINSNSVDCSDIKSVADGVSDAFASATKDIGEIKVYASVGINTPHYQELDINIAEINYRKFRLKFAKGNK